MNQTVTLPIRRPPLSLLGTEPIRAALEFISLKFARSQPHAAGDGHPVVLFPGLGADGTSLGPLRNHCLSLGYRAMDWGRGYNTGPHGDVDIWLGELAADISGLLGESSERATLIGWSLGGVYARETAKLLRGKVRQVITIGTPFNADADHSNVGWAYRLLNGSAVSLDPGLSKRLRAISAVKDLLTLLPTPAE